MSVMKKERPQIAAVEGGIETITPQVAEIYLSQNIRNRSLVAVTVDRYKRDMLAGRWRLSGDPIRFNRKGEMFDGQHRLRACIESGVPFQSLVVRNLDEEVVNVIDSGRPRRGSDMLAIRGYAQTYVLAAAARWLMIMKGNKSPTAKLDTLRPSHEEILSVVEKHPLLPESVKVATLGAVGLNASLLTAIHYVASHHLVEPKPDRATAFAEVFVRGVPDYPGDPAHKLREMLLREKLRKVYPTQSLLYAGACYAWNSFAERKPIAAMRIPDEARIKGLLTENL